MTLLDLILLAIALLLIRFAAMPALVTLIIALAVMIAFRVSKGERIP
jgi:hypothetical protein